MTGPLPSEDLKLNPNVPHPPFEWLIGLPADWSLLDTNPESWQRSAERLVDDRFHGRKLPAAERRGVLGFLEQLVADCQGAGAALSLVQLGRMSTGQVGSAGMHLGWFNSAPNLASLALVREALPQSGLVYTVDTSCGPALLHRDEASSLPPGGTTRVRSVVWQIYVPVPETTWTALLSAATPHPEMHPAVEDAIVAVARSLLPVESDGSPDGDDSPPPPAPTEGEPEFRPIPTQRMPGIERGFGTQLRQPRPPDGETFGLGGLAHA
jgi:hypothetical protein